MDAQETVWYEGRTLDGICRVTNSISLTVKGVKEAIDKANEGKEAQKIYMICRYTHRKWIDSDGVMDREIVILESMMKYPEVGA